MKSGYPYLGNWTIPLNYYKKNDKNSKNKKIDLLRSPFEGTTIEVIFSSLGTKSFIVLKKNLTDFDVMDEGKYATTQLSGEKIFSFTNFYLECTQYPLSEY